MSDIPKAREIIKDVMGEVGHGQRVKLAEALALMSRKKYKPRSSIKSQSMSKSLAAQIFAHHVNNPDASAAEIAVRFNVNPGRVSEVIAQYNATEGQNDE